MANTERPMPFISREEAQERERDLAKAKREAALDALPDLTDEAVPVEDEASSVSQEVRSNLDDVMRIQEERTGEKETLRATAEALELSKGTGEAIEAKKVAEAAKSEAERQAKIEAVRRELQDLGIVPKDQKEAFAKHLAERLEEGRRAAHVADPEKEAAAAVSMEESVRDMLRTDVERMAADIQAKYGVDVDQSYGKNLFDRIGFGFRKLMDGGLRRALTDYRAKRDELNAKSDKIEEDRMTQQDWSNRASRNFINRKTK